ncbi:MAG: hypothetical protein WCI93_01510 [bacterium]
MKKNIIMKNVKKIALFGSLLSIVLLPVLTFAEVKGDAPVDPKATTIINPISATSLTDLIQSVLVGVIKIGLPIIALAIIYCGFLFVAARGNSEKIGKAKDALLYTLIGAAILLGSWAIALLIKDTVLTL